MGDSLRFCAEQFMLDGRMIKSVNSNRSAREPVDEPGIVSSGMGAPPVSRGHKVENHLPTDDLVTENSVEQGIEDAEDDFISRAKKEGSPAEG